MAAGAAALVPLMVAAGAATATAAAATPAGALTRSCQMVEIPVALAAGDPADQHLAADYCVPPGSRARAADVLVPGATYNDTYWDWPQDPQLYSYVDKTLAAGRATLAISRLGTGASSHPASSAVTPAVSAYAVHQAIQWIRARGYAQVDLIGHSLGSVIAVMVAASWPGDANRVVLTGYLNDLTPGDAAAQGDVYPAVDDPLFAHSGLDSGYLTTRPGVRAALFYYHGNPQMEAYDEAHKDVLSGPEFAAVGAIADPPSTNPSSSVTVPVLIVVGQEDYLMCSAGAPDCTSTGALQSYEQPYFSRSPSLTVRSVPDTGHDLALSSTADESFAWINSWIDLAGGRRPAAP